LAGTETVDERTAAAVTGRATCCGAGLATGAADAAAADATFSMVRFNVHTSVGT
jgi:hypothetical protein